MASSLISNINNEYYQQANSLDGTPNRIQVLVEDLIDVPVWYKILNHVNPNKHFVVTPYYDKAKSMGKTHVLDMSSQFGDYFIGCVDSDFDWLLEDYTKEGAIIKNNPYILQTFAYSIENLTAQPYDLSSTIVNSTLCTEGQVQSLNNDAINFIESISKSVYPVLIWILLFKKKRIRISIQEIWDKLFNGRIYDYIVNNQGIGLDKMQKHVIKKFDKSAKLLIRNFEYCYPKFTDRVLKLKDELKVKYNLSSKNAFLFVRGHDLQKFMHHVFFSPIEKDLINITQQHISNFPHSEQRSLALKNYKNLRTAFQLLQDRNTEFIKDLSNPISQLVTIEIKNLFP